MARELEDARSARSAEGPALIAALLALYAPRLFAGEALARELVEGIVERLPSMELPPVLDGGLPLAGAVLIEAEARGAGARRTAPMLRAIDRALAAYLDDPDDLGVNDLVGTGAIGTYACLRGELGLLERWLELQVSASEPGPTGHPAWLSRKRDLAFLGEDLISDRPETALDLGVAHGVPGIAAVVAEAAQKLGRAEPASLARAALDGVLSFRQPPAPSALPAIVSSPPPHDGQSRSAWCYGDAGVATAIHRAGTILGDAALCVAALELARDAAVRPFETTQVEDGFVCHGSAGLALIFGGFAELTGEAVFADAAERYAVHASEAIEAVSRLGQGSLLESRASTALVLTSFLTGERPSWARLLVALPSA